MTKPRWRNPDKRMARAVELRAQGLSLRRIGTELAVDEKTIRNDLARWEGQQDDCQVLPFRHAAAESGVRNSAVIPQRNSAVIPEEGA